MSSNRALLGKYLELCDEFLKNNISCDDFREEFFESYQKEPVGMSDEVFAVLEALFFSVEQCEPDPEILKGLRDSPVDLEYLDENQLRERVADFIKKASEMMGQKGR